ncbi:MAG: NAD-dependent deacylase [Planctomycetota bacterium]|nr:NAD-dependent deacylase [Planctomycetota bacterium]
MMEPVLSAEVMDAARGAQRVAVLTGAGVSAESGIPTFRGAGGLWKDHRPEELATPEAFAEDPKLVWEWYDWRRSLIAAAIPNPGHRALAEWERSIPEFTLITQNVDGLHHLAGSRRLVELHGNIWRTRCGGCGRMDEDRRVPLPEHPPHCSTCRGLLRPDVIWFGESLDPDVLTTATEASNRCDLFLVAGTSGVVEPAASLARLALQSGATVIEVNPDRTSLSAIAHHSLAGRSGDILPRLIA